MLGLVDVATGRLVSSTEVPPCEYSANPSGPFPVVLQWSPRGGPCEDHTVLAPDAAGRLRPIATIHPPAALPDDDVGDVSVEGCDLFCTSNRILVTHDAIVLSAVWSSDDSIADLVVLSPEGDVRWRATDVAGRAGPIPAPIGLVTVDDDHVVAGWADHWRLLSLSDGAEIVARQGHGVGTPITVADTERFYRQAAGDADADQVVAMRISDLAPQGEFLLSPSDDQPELLLSVTAGRLITTRPHSLVAYAAEGGTGG